MTEENRETDTGNLPPPELPLYVEAQKGISNSNSNLAVSNNDNGYSSEGGLFSSNSMNENISQNSVGQIPSINQTYTGTLFINTNQSIYPSESQINKPSIEEDKGNIVTSIGNESTPADPMKTIENDKIQPLNIEVKSIREKDCITRYCELTLEENELKGLIINLILYGWMSLLIISYEGIIHFPRPLGLIDSNNIYFSRFGSSSDSLGEYLLSLIIIIFIVVLIILIPVIYPELIFVLIYIIYVYYHYESSSSLLYKICLFSSFAWVYKLIARCNHV